MHLNSLILPCINFALYLAFLSWAYKKYVAPSLRARSASIHALLNKAAIDMADAERALAKLQAELDDLRTERESLIAEFRAEGERIALSLQAQTKEEAERILRDAQAQSLALQEQAEKEIRLEIIRGAVAKAQTLLRTELTAGRDAELRKEILTALN